MSLKKYLLILGLLFAFVPIAKPQSLPKLPDTIMKMINNANAELDKLDFQKSLIINKDALDLAFKLKDDNAIANVYNNIAYIYEELNEHKQALQYYDLASRYGSKANNLIVLHYVYNNKANIYFYFLKNQKLGIDYYKKSIEISSKLKDTASTAFTNTNLALAYFSLNDNIKGFECVDFLNKNKKFLQDNSSTATMLMINGISESKKGHFDKSKEFFSKAINFAIKKDLHQDLATIYEEYVNVLKENKDFENAIIYLEKFNVEEQKIHNDKMLKNAQLIGKKIDLDVYKNEYNRSENENKSQRMIIQKNKIINSLLLLMLGILLFFIFFAVKNNKAKQKTNKLLEINNFELEAANKKAIESNNLKSQFVSTISHELRTPLYGVIGITNMLVDEHKELSGSTHLKSLEFSANYLLSLVNDILHINKIDENKVALDKYSFNLYEEVLLIKNSLNFIAENNNNLFLINFDHNIPKFLDGDKLRLDQILMNLISNALKFTKSGTVTINISLINYIDDKNHIKFEIIDTGVGIAPENIDKIFDKFVQVGENNEEYQGTGLGLSIVKKLIDLFESAIKVESKVGFGTTFTFTIPFETTQEKIETDVVDQEVIATNRRFNILVVEDNKINQMVTKKIIEKNNSTCVIAESGFKALEIIENEVFDIILMDINMPIINGYETTKLIRKKGIEIPIIALTAYSKTEIFEKVYASGMNDILIKPFEAPKLFEVILENVNKK